MSCKALKLKGCEIKGSTFQGRKFIFPNRDISNDIFTLKIPKINLEIIGLIQGNEVFFSYESLESFKTGLNIIEFWADFDLIGSELIAIEDFYISNDICSCEQLQMSSFILEFPEENINYSVEYSIINISVGTDTPLEIKTKYESNTNTNAYTDLEKQKLAGLDSNKFKGKLPSFEDLELITNNDPGSYAYVGGIGVNDVSYIWDSDDSIWVPNLSIPNAETPASIKAKYESNINTNAYTDTEKTKLASLQNYDDSNNLKFVEVLITSSTVLPLTIVPAVANKVLFWMDGAIYTDSLISGLTITFGYGNGGNVIFLENAPTTKTSNLTIGNPNNVGMIRTLSNKYSGTSGQEIIYSTNLSKSIEVRALSSPLEAGKIIKLKVMYTTL